MQDAEAMKALAEPLGELIQDLLQESPLTWQLLQPHLPPSLIPPTAVCPTQPIPPIPAPLLESLQAAVQPVGELIKDLLTHAPGAVPYLRPYLEAFAPTIDQSERPNDPP
jgi:hypothetical protein